MAMSDEKRQGRVGFVLGTITGAIAPVSLVTLVSAEPQHGWITIEFRGHRYNVSVEEDS